MFSDFFLESFVEKEEFFLADGCRYLNYEVFLRNYGNYKLLSSLIWLCFTQIIVRNSGVTCIEFIIKGSYINFKSILNLKLNFWKILPIIKFSHLQQYLWKNNVYSQHHFFFSLLKPHFTQFYKEK